MCIAFEATSLAAEAVSVAVAAPNAVGSEGGLMRIVGWKDRQMVDRYAADLPRQTRRGDMY
jgi:hypothetical protein